MTCQFSEPLQIQEGGELAIPTTQNANFQFSKIVCDNPTTTELITNPDYPERNFFIEKTLTYGDVLVIWFLTLFFIALVSKFIFDFFWKK